MVLTKGELAGLDWIRSDRLGWDRFGSLTFVGWLTGWMRVFISGQAEI